MGLFSGWKRSSDADRFATLSGRVDDTESAIRKMRAEWQDVLDRMERILGRLNKRARRAAMPVEEESEASNDGEVAAPVSDFDREMQLRRGGRGPQVA